MAGELSIVGGRGAAYFRGDSEGRPARSSGADYYSGAKEPAGTWHGAGCADLGLTEGAEIDGDKFVALMDDHIDPRDGVTRLGKKMHKPDVHQKYAELLSREPEATAERRGELFTAAQAHVRKHESVGYFDIMFAPSKSITLVHASALAMKAQADAAGDAVKSAQAQRVMDCVERAIDHGAQAGMDYLIKHAGFTRKGAGGVRQVEARGWIYATFAHHTSRAGDPHLHRHCPLVNVVQHDGKWLTPDSSAINSQRPGAEAVAVATMENDLTKDLGLAWYDRADGLGREVRGVPQALIEEFSTRSRDEIPQRLAELVAAFAGEYGRDPSPREMHKLQQQAGRETKSAKNPDDPRADVREWSARAAREAGQALEPIAAQVCGQAQGSAQFTRAQEDALVRDAVSKLQAQKSKFTQAALTRAIQQVLPTDMPVIDRPALWLDELSGRALTGEAGVRLVSLTAPRLFSAVPQSLLRSDGELQYTRHRSAEYATEAQLRMEGNITEIAAERSSSVPHLQPADAATLLGAEQAQLEAQLVPGTPADTSTVTGSGLHLDQAAAAYAMLTSDRRMEIMVGPAGTGKSKTLATVASIWKEVHPGARVIGLTTSQQAANVLKEMGLDDSHNLSMFFTDPRLTRDIPPHSLLLVDEASMVSMGHWDALLRLARERNCAVRPAGDHAQHQAVTAGGGMGMLVRQLGSWQLGEALRFCNEWERDASMRLRTGDQSVISVYDQRGRILSGTREQMIEESYSRWLQDYLAGKDSVLIAMSETDCKEMSRRARADLIRYGKVSDGPAVRLRDGLEASAGDTIMSRKNKSHLSAGVEGRKVANRDVYAVDEVRPDGSAVVRLQLRDGGSGDQVVLTAGYLAEKCHLAYGRTSHDVQGSTFRGFGYALITPENDREFLYTAMSRAVQGNVAFAVTETRQADSRNEHESAPEVARARTLQAQREGTDPGRDRFEGFRDGAGVLASVAGKSDPELSATEHLEREQSEADSLATMIKYWTDLSAESYLVSYRDVLHEVLGPEVAAKVASDHHATWLHRTLRAAELAGMDSKVVLRQAAELGDLDDAKSVAAVLDHRARQIIPTTIPLGGGWAARAPQAADPELTDMLADIGAQMDNRIVRLGEHAVLTQPAWAKRNLGAVPDDPAERQDWQDRAAAVAAYREMATYENAADPIGPCPPASDPEKRAAWHTALMALGKTDGIDLSEMSMEGLQARRAAYARETAWAPAYAGRELRLARQARDQADVRSKQSMREMLAAGDDTETRARHYANARAWMSLQGRAAKAADLYAEAMETRAAWSAITDRTLRVAQAADLELRRRDPWGQRQPLKSMEPDSDLLPDVEGEPDDIQVLTALGLTLEAQEVSDHPQRTAEAAKIAQERINERTSSKELAWDGDVEADEPWKAALARDRAAVAQPAVRLVRPSARVLERDDDSRDSLLESSWPEPLNPSVGYQPNAGFEAG